MVFRCPRNPLLGLSLPLALTLAACSGTEEEGGEPQPTLSIDTFVTSATSVAPGDTVELSWTTTGASQVSIVTDSNITVLNTTERAGSVTTEPLNETTSFTLTASANGNSVDQTLTVTVQTVDTPPSVTSFAATPDTLIEGESSTLAWQVTGTEPVTIVITDGDGTEITSSTNLTGTMMVTPVATTTYTLVATNSAGSDMAMESITVNPPMGARVVDFSAEPTDIAPGQSSVLSWTVENADRVVVTSGGMTLSDSTALTGSLTVMPMMTTAYELTAFNANGNANGAETITVTPIQPIIDSFTATPDLVAAGDVAVLAWQVSMTEQVLIRQGATVLTTTTASSGSVMATVPAGNATFTLEATNPGASETATVEVRGLQAPMISVFTASPQQSGTTVTATIAWQVSDVTTLTLTANGTAVGGFPGVTTSTVVDAQGSLPITVTETTEFVLTATNFAGSSNASQTVSIVQLPVVETEPNDSFGSANTVAIGAMNTATVQGAISAGTDEDWYAVAVPAGASIYAETNDGMGGCNFDTILSLYAPDGTTQLARNDDRDGANNRCSLIDPTDLSGAAGLAAGTYFLRVESFDTNTGNYTLDIRVIPAQCGNGILELAAGEQCDDSSTMAMDGCSATCQLEPENTYTGPSLAMTFSDAIDPATDYDVVRLTVTSTSFLSADTFTQTASRACASADTLLTLYADDGVTVIGEDDADGVASCSRIEPTDSFALLGPGNYWLVLREDGADAVIPNIDLSVRLATINTCGNGVREGAEECDDANIAAGDGCDATCMIEYEGRYTAPGATATVAASIAAAGQIDSFLITVTSTSFVTMESFDNAANQTCATIDTVFTLRDSMGATVATNDDGGVGLCSRISNLSLAPGTYRLDVNDFDNDDPIPAYDVVFRSAMAPTPPTATTAEVEPNDTRATAQPLGINNGNGFVAIGASFTASDDDYFSFTVPAGQTATFRAVTHGTLNDFDTCPTDTILTLQDSAGTTITSGDDSGFDVCSDITASLSPGTYFVYAEQFNGLSAPSYLLSVILF